MIQIGDVIVSFELFRQYFVCDLSACQGECCIEGDAGAPLQTCEIEQLTKVLPHVWGNLSPAARNVIQTQGVAYVDHDGEWVTSIVGGKDCVFTCYDESGCCHCSIEKAYRAGKTDFYKPISCHLYPIRISRIGDYDALNYHRWHVCHAAETLGKAKGVPVYRFLKEPLIRKYGEAWYEELETAAQEYARAADE
ncbi:MAG: DUF3109 family protein [Prevotellaceae bacterium]|jgi:hypothetical protein|nr:DUF3109 family protein [Prevotellaceae bacterium]